MKIERSERIGFPSQNSLHGRMFACFSAIDLKKPAPESMHSEHLLYAGCCALYFLGAILSIYLQCSLPSHLVKKYKKPPFLLAVTFYKKRQSTLVVELGEGVTKLVAACGGDKEEGERMGEDAALGVAL